MRILNVFVYLVTVVWSVLSVFRGFYFPKVVVTLGLTSLLVSLCLAIGLLPLCVVYIGRNGVICARCFTYRPYVGVVSLSGSICFGVEERAALSGVVCPDDLVWSYEFVLH